MSSAYHSNGRCSIARYHGFSSTNIWVIQYSQASRLKKALLLWEPTTHLLVITTLLVQGFRSFFSEWSEHSHTLRIIVWGEGSPSAVLDHHFRFSPQSCFSKDDLSWELFCFLSGEKDPNNNMVHTVTRGTVEEPRYSSLHLLTYRYSMRGWRKSRARFLASGALQESLLNSPAIVTWAPDLTKLWHGTGGHIYRLETISSCICWCVSSTS